MMAQYSQTTCSEEDKILLQPYQHIAGANKRTCLLTIHVFGYWLKCPEEIMNDRREMFEMIFNVILAMDDMVDDSVLRRGIPATYLVYGIPKTLSVIRYVFDVVLKNMAEFHDPREVDYLIEFSIQLFNGQGMEMHFQDKCICPTEEEYMEIVYNKTTSAFRFILRVGQLYSPDSTQDFTKFLEKLGLYFQIQNDYQDLRSDEPGPGKSFCEDISHGKFSFPIIHAIRSQPNNDEILNIVRQRPTQIEIKKYFLKLLDKCGSFEYTRKMLKKLKDEICQEVQILGGNPHIEQLFNIFTKNRI